MHKFVALHKEQHTLMDNLANHGYSDIDYGIKVHHFLQGIKSSALKAVINLIKAWPEKYNQDFATTASYQGQLITKKGNN